MNRIHILLTTAALALGAEGTAAQTPPAREAEPEFSASRAAFTQRGGETLYRTICQGCHMPQGQGAQGAGRYPALAANPRLGGSAYPIAVVMNGLHGMPGFAQRLDNQQVADVVNYVRSHFGNAYADLATADDVQVFRAAR